MTINSKIKKTLWVAGFLFLTGAVMPYPASAQGNAPTAKHHHHHHHHKPHNKT